MANIPVINALGSAVYLKTAGAGLVGDPHIPSHVVDSITAALPAGNNNVGNVDIVSLVGDDADLDSGAGSDAHGLLAIGLPGAGGHVVGGVGANPFRVDPVASTVQPVSLASQYIPLTTLASLAGIGAVQGSMHVGNFPAVQPVSLVSQYLPATVLASVAGVPSFVGSVHLANALVTLAGINATIFAVVNTSAPGVTDVAIQSQYIPLSTVASVVGFPVVVATLPNPVSVVGSAHVGNFPAVQGVSLMSSYIPQNVVASTIGTVFAVVNTAAAGSQFNYIEGQAADGLAPSGNPLVIAGRARGALAAGEVVDAGDVARLLADLTGAIVTRPFAIPEVLVSGIGYVNGVTTAIGVLAAAGASVRNYITQLTVVNAAVSAGTPVNVGDGSATLFTGYAAEKGGGFAVQFPTPLRPAQNATIVVAATIASALLHVNVSGYKGW